MIGKAKIQQRKFQLLTSFTAVASSSWPSHYRMHPAKVITAPRGLQAVPSQRLEWPAHVLALQCVAGSWAAVEFALLAAGICASRKISGRATRAPGKVPRRLSYDPHLATIWVHAVSVGEVVAITGLVFELRGRFPQHRIAVSTTTATGQKIAQERFGEDSVFYFPLDLPFAIRPYLQRLRPQLIVLAETEFWPNFLRLAHLSGAIAPAKMCEA